MQRSRRTKLRGVLQASCCLKRSDCCLPPKPVYFLEDSRRFYELLSPVLLLLSLTVLHLSPPIMVWKKPEESAPKKAKVTISAGKVLAIVFWDCKGVLLVDYLPPNTTVNAARYCEVLTKLRAAIKWKRPGLLSRKVLLVHDNARLTQLEQPKRCWKTSNGKFSHIHLILRSLPQATSIFFQHSSCTLEASTLRMMTKCRRRRTTGYEDRTRLGTTVVSKNCYNGTNNVWTEIVIM
ncbi:hypothetical protein LAZ67_10003627 [Cordylochernes scorpioides]|uniref:Transposase n=1 Tax=Cordylochernes scorpioides TaxID=51811 RepID=A0ABY6KYZ6_9ARAC|nr:hypothetical protein LAZ67_10003627 [Cordylochernes scorpioides]